MGGRIDHKAHDLAEQAVDTFADRQIGRLTAEMGSQRLLQVEILRIRVFPAFGTRNAHGRDDGRRRTKSVLIGADPRPDGEMAIALDGLGADEGNGGGKGTDERSEALEGWHWKYVRFLKVGTQ